MGTLYKALIILKWRDVLTHTVCDVAYDDTDAQLMILPNQFPPECPDRNSRAMVCYLIGKEKLARVDHPEYGWRVDELVDLDIAPIPQTPN